MTHYCMTCSNSLSRVEKDNYTLHICTFCGEVIKEVDGKFTYIGKTSGSASTHSLLDVLNEFD